jgi:hypothetical protein
MTILERLDSKIEAFIDKYPRPIDIPIYYLIPILFFIYIGLSFVGFKNRITRM